MDCWARDVSPCKGAQSGEHYVSKSLLPTNPVKIRGLPFCRDEIREIPISSLKANILCEGHNSELSTLDSEMKRFRDAIFATEVRANVGSAAAKPVHVSGASLLRWTAKTYCNFVSIERALLEPEFACVAFGASTESFHFYTWRPLRYDAPRYRLAGEQLDEHFHFDYSRSQARVMVFVKFFGLRLLLANFNARNLPVLANEWRTIDTRDLIERPTRFEFLRGKQDGDVAPSHEVYIDW